MFLIAEVGQAHEGSLGIAHSYIDALAETGVDAVKFQTHIAEAESSSHEPFRVNFSYEDDTRFDYWKRMEFTKEQWMGLKKHCDVTGVEFISSPFSNAAVDLLEEIGVKRYKIGSGEVNNFLLLDRIAKTGKPIIVSSGMSSFEELDTTVQFLQKRKANIQILQCTTSYPTRPENWGLNVIAELKERYDVPIGFSDHSGDIYSCLFAAAQGAEILEFHAVFDKSMFGPDAPASMTMNQIKQLVKGTKQFELARQNEIDKSDNSQYHELKGIFEKSLAVNKKMLKGAKIQIDDLEAKKPKGKGIDASKFETILGRVLNKDLGQWDFLKEEDLQ
jgi:N-acetylneuraminate synthase